MKSEKLVFDVGFHKCEDLDFYLFKGYRVVAIDADAENVSSAKKKYQKEVDNGGLILINVAITNEDDIDVIFNKSEFTAWSSTNVNIANRKDTPYSEIAVKGKKLSSLFSEYGLPFYCKIDIEGNDIVALNSLSSMSQIPEFISVETECVGEKEVISEGQSLETLIQLYNLGYRKFKLIEQATLNELLLDKQFYDINFEEEDNRAMLQNKFRYTFARGSSGPFGNDLDGSWLSFEGAKQCLLRHRMDYFNLPKTKNYGFWCDWHAKLR